MKFKINIRKTLKTIGFILGGLIILVVLLVLSLRIPAVQNYVKDHLIDFLENKIETEVALEKVYVSFPNRIEIHQLYLQDQNSDTLIWVKDLDVGLQIWKLLDSKADFTSISLEGARAKVVRDESGKFNFDYILDAFATEDDDEPSNPFIISLDDIELKDVGVSFIDLQARNDFNVYFNQFETRVRTFDLEKNTYEVDKIEMDGLKLSLHQDLVAEIAQEAEETIDSLSQLNPLSIDLNQIKFTNFEIDYADENTQTFAQIIFDELNTEINQINLEQQIYEVDQFRLANAKIHANLDLNPSSQENEIEVNSASETTLNPMSVLVNQFQLQNVALVYNNIAIPNSNEGMDFNHLDFSKINLELEDFEMKNNAFVGNIISTEIEEKSGLHIQEFQSEFAYTSNQAFLKNLYLKTPQTLLQDEILLTYDDFQQLSEDLGNVNIQANIQNSSISFSDILILQPNLKEIDAFRNYPNGILKVHTRLNGKINDLMFHHLEISGLDRLTLNASGNIKNAMNPENITFDVEVNEFSTESHTLYKLLPPNSIPSEVSLPNYFNLTGFARGSTENIFTDLDLTSSFGNAQMLANLDMRNKNQEIYRVDAQLQNFDVGKLIQNQEIGVLTAQISAQGQSFDLNRAKADVNGHIQRFEYNDYAYQNIDLSGNIQQSHYEIELKSQDENADMDLLASGIFQENQPTLNLVGDITKLDLNALGFYESPMIFNGEILADFENLNPDDLNGSLSLQNFAFSDTKDVFPIQDLILRAESTQDSTTISLASQILDMEIKGNYNPTEIFTSLLQSLNHYYEFQNMDEQIEIAEGQFFNLEANLKNDHLIQKFLPELTSFENININGKYVTDNNEIQLSAEIPRLEYAGNMIENAVLNIENLDQALHYNFDLASFGNDNFSLDRLNLSGEIADNQIHYKLTTLDADDNEQYRIAGMLQTMDEITEISLHPDGLILNEETWMVNENNRIRLTSTGILADNFRISKEGSEILLQSESQNENSPLNIQIRNFQIQDITEIIKKDSLLASGNIDADVQIRNLMQNPVFDADLNLSSLKVFGNPVGNLNATLQSISENNIQADLVLSENQNDVHVSGQINTSTMNFDMLLDIRALQMASLQGFTMNEVVDAEGFLSGNLQLQGNMDAPEIRGKLNFNDVGFVVAQTGSDFRNISDEIDFTARGMEFSDFHINDKQGNSLRVNGEILTENYQDFAFHLDLNAEGFNVVNSEESSDAMMYGTLEIDADLQVRGDLNLPIVDGNISISDDTDFVFVLPQSSPTLQEREGIVEFIDKDQVVLNETLVEETFDSQTQFTGMDVNVNIELNKDAKLSIIIDKANGDFVELQGEAELTGGIDPSGKTTLVGVFQVEDGGYELNVSLLKRRFDIQKGSTITWTGEPMDALLDITAIYTTEAAPLDLLEQQLTGLPQSEMNLYKQRIPFHTLLKLGGELMEPEITFDITTDESNAQVASSVLDNTEAKLAQLRTEEAEMNKQVFALLLLNRFVGENPFESSTGLSAESMARQSVSNILSQQLNNLTSDLIAGVDLNFDLESSEDYSMGEKNTRTDLNVELSKRLLDDRLKVSVGSNFGIEGDARQNEQTTNIAGDVTLDYMLSRDGRYMLRAYRKDEYQVALQGQIIETGVGFIITLDYDKFREIFQSSKRSNRNKN